jgi:hypothetical protein
VGALMSDPDVYMKWLAASADANCSTAVLTQFSAPGTNDAMA